VKAPGARTSQHSIASRLENMARRFEGCDAVRLRAAANYLGVPEDVLLAKVPRARFAFTVRGGVPWLQLRKPDPEPTPVPRVRTGELTEADL